MQPMNESRVTKDIHIDETTPDHLMDNFRGRSMKSIVMFTLVVHVVGLTLTSTSYLWKLVAGDDSSKLSEEKRLELAATEATASLRDIASKHGLKPQELSDRFASKAPKAAAEDTATDAPKVEAPKTEAPKTETPNAANVPEKPKSEIEKEINTKEAGPELPSIGDEKEDLFK